MMYTFGSGKHFTSNYVTYEPDVSYGRNFYSLNEKEQTLCLAHLFY